MNRRNFIGNLLAIGAGFSILPPATTYGRIWTAERKVMVPTEGMKSIWQTHYMSWHLEPWRDPPLKDAKVGEIAKVNPDGTMWYKFSDGMCLLRPHRRPLNWEITTNLIIP